MSTLLIVILLQLDCERCAQTKGYVLHVSMRLIPHVDRVVHLHRSGTIGVKVDEVVLIVKY